MGPGTTPEDHGPSDPLSQPLGAFSEKESQSEFKSTLRTGVFFIFLPFFLPSALSFVHSFVPSFLSFFSSYTRVMFALLEAGVPPSLKKGFLSPHSPADRATPAVAKLCLPRGPGKGSKYVGSQDKGAWQAHSNPCTPDSCPGKRPSWNPAWRSREGPCSHSPGGYQKTPRATLPGTHTPSRLKSPLFHFFPPFPGPQQIVMHKPERKCRSLKSVWLVVTPWSVGRQSPLSIGILQTRTLEWTAIPFSRGSSQPRDRTPSIPSLQADSLPSHQRSPEQAHAHL